MWIEDSCRQVRVGGLPYCTVNGLIDNQLAQQVSLIREQFLVLQENRNKIDVLLHDAIGQTEGKQRKSLVLLRRRLYQLDLRGAVLAYAQLERRERSDISQLIANKIPGADLIGLHEAMKLLRADFVLYQNSERQHLVNLTSNNRFMDGIAVSSASLLAAIKRLSQHVKEQKLDKRDIKTTRSLQSYAIRAAVKTSPFSYLGRIVLLDESTDSPAEIRAQSKPSMYPVARIFNHASTDAAKLASLPVRIARETAVNGDVAVVNRTSWEYKDLDIGHDYAHPSQTSVKLRQHNLIAFVYNIVGNSQMRLGALETRLREQCGISNEQVWLLLSDLLRLGYLEVPALTLHPSDVGRVSSIVDAMDALDPHLGVLGRDYFKDATQLADIRDPEERSLSIQKMSGTVRRMYECAGIDAKPPRSVVYEDIVETGLEKTESPVRHMTERTLDLLLSLLDIVDDAKISNALMRGYFLSLGQASISADIFVPNFTDSLYQSFESHDISEVEDEDLPDDPWLVWGGAWRWVLARRQLSDSITSLAEEYPLNEGCNCQSAGSIDLSDILRESSRFLEKETPAYRHMNLLLQTVGSSYVLNDAFGGIGFQVSRFTDFVTDAKAFTKTARQTAERNGITLAEICGGALYSNLNLHEALFDHSLILPGDPERNNVESKIYLSDLDVRYQASEHRLVLHDRERNKVIYPVYCGYLVPKATPINTQIISLFTPSSQIGAKISSLSKKKPRLGHMVVHPRLVLNDVIIARRHLTFCISDFPSENPLHLEGYSRWLHFWSANALPMRFFATLVTDLPSKKKPNMYDIRLLTSMSALHNLLSAATRGSYLDLTELLPSEPTDVVGEAQVISEHMVGLNFIKDQS